MAKRGRKPTPAALKGRKSGKKSDNTQRPGAAGRKPGTSPDKVPSAPARKAAPKRKAPAKGEAEPTVEDGRRLEPLEPPKQLGKVQQQAWDDYIQPAWWLTRWDVPLAFQFVCLYAEYLGSPTKMIASRQAEMRRCMNELHLSSVEQSRLGLDTTKKRGAARFFTRRAQ